MIEGINKEEKKEDKSIKSLSEFTGLSEEVKNLINKEKEYLFKTKEGSGKYPGQMEVFVKNIKEDTTKLIEE